MPGDMQPPHTKARAQSGSCTPNTIRPLLFYSVPPSLGPWAILACRDAAAFTRNLRTAHALWAQLAAEVRATDLAAAEAAGDTSLRVCLAKLKVSTYVGGW